MALRTKNRIKIGAAIAACLVCAAMAPSIALAADGDDAAPQTASEKNETVRVFADATGKPLNVEVQTILRNGNGASFLLDETDLTDIVPKDDCGYTVDNTDLIWQADGLDVTYTGVTAKDVPIAVSVTYTLDGKTVGPDELAGASGHVTIHYDYENNAIVDGTATPFMMITGLLLDDSKFSNVAVKNGKIISDEDRTIVVGYALPGMQTSLELDKEDMELPAYFEIEADVTDFELNATLTMASSNLFDDFSRADLDITELSDSVRGLSSALGEIIDGAKEFRDGMNDLNEGAKSLADALNAMNENLPSLVNGIGQLETGSQNLKQGLDDAIRGIADIDVGATGVSNGLYVLLYGDGTNPGMTTLVEKIPEMIDGAKQVGDGLERLSKEGLPALKDAVDSMTESLSSEQAQQLIKLIQAAQMEISGYNTAVAQIKQTSDGAASMANSLSETLGSIDTTGMTAEQIAAIEAAKEQAGGLSKMLEGLSAGVSELSTEYSSLTVDALDSFIGSIESLKGGLSSVSAGINDIIANLDESAIAGAAKLQAAAEEVSKGVSEIEKGLEKIYGAASEVAGGISQLGSQEDGLPAAAEGAAALASGLGELGNNAGTLQSGVNELAEGAEVLHEGTESASSGADELLDGLQKYKDEGINELVNKVDVELQGYIDRFFASADLGRAYDNFGGKAEGTPSSVKFVFELEGISSGA